MFELKRLSKEAIPAALDRPCATACSMNRLRPKHLPEHLRTSIPVARRRSFLLLPSL